MGVHRTTEEYKRLTLEAIEKYHLFFFEQISSFCPFSKTTLILHEIHKDEEVIQALESNRIKTLHNQYYQWSKSKNPILQIALAKVLETEENYHRLANTKQDITVNQDPPLFRLTDGIEEAELDEGNNSDTETS